MLIGAMMKAGGEFFEGGLRIDVDKNEDGIYNPWFTVTTQSGHRVVITVTSLS